MLEKEGREGTHVRGLYGLGNGAGPGADRDQNGQRASTIEAAGVLQKKEVPGSIRLGFGGVAVLTSESAPAFRDTRGKKAVADGGYQVVSCSLPRDMM
jgi:hypothetical protein